MSLLQELFATPSCTTWIWPVSKKTLPTHAP